MKSFISAPTFSKSLFAGLLTGILAALLNLVYIIVYRESTNFATDLIVMPLTIFIGYPILMVLAGVAYFLLQKHLHSGAIWFMGICFIGMIALLIVTIRDTSLNHGTLLTGARGLFLGMVVITFLAALLIPYLARHSKIYQ
jgi:magnesium-transporting ATPase (P-type)